MRDGQRVVPAMRQRRCGKAVERSGDRHGCEQNLASYKMHHGRTIVQQGFSSKLQLPARINNIAFLPVGAAYERHQLVSSVRDGH